MLFLFFPALLFFKEKKSSGAVSLQYFCNRHLIQQPFPPPQESQTSDLGTLFGDPCCSSEVSVDHVSNKGTGSR